MVQIACIAVCVALQLLTMAKKAVEVKNLVKAFRGGVKAVDKVSFSIDEGEFFGFLGPNGAGKTTTMRILATLTKPTSGKVLVNGVDVVKNPNEVRRSIGFAMQAVGLDDLATAWENLQLIGCLYGLSRKDAKSRAGELLDLLGLKDAAGRYVAKYSGGMRRRLDIAVALMHRPKILFLDEPTEGLDPAGRRVVWQYLENLNRDGVTIFLTTHYMEEADYLTRNLAIINGGKIVAAGTPQNLKKSIRESHIELELKEKNKASKIISQRFPKLPYRSSATGIEIVSRDGEADMHRIIKFLGDAKVRVKGFNLHSPTLEDVFLKYAGHSFENEEVGRGVDPYLAMRGRG